METIKFILKEFTGGQKLTIRQRAILLWWGLSIFSCLIFAESFTLLCVAAANVGIATKYMKELPTPQSIS